MIFIKLLPPILAFISGLLHLGLASKWKDRRTKKHRFVLKLMASIIIFAMLPTVWIIREDDKRKQLDQNKIKALQKGVDILNSKLDPFITVAKRNYPELNKQAALEKLRSDLYNPKERLKSFLERVNKEECMSDSDATKLISMTKQLITYRQEEILCPVVLFYCDWVLSIKVSGSYATCLILSQITDVFLSDNGINKVDIPLQVSELLSIKKFQKQLITLYASESLPTFIFTDSRNWKGFMGFILKEIVGKVIEFPPDIENRNDYPAKIYKDMKVKADTHEWLMARKLWLSDNVKGKKEGAVYWFVETNPRVVINGRLRFTELEEDFNNYE